MRIDCDSQTHIVCVAALHWHFEVRNDEILDIYSSSQANDSP